MADGMAAPPIDREIALAHLRLHYLDWGNAGAPALLLIHGGLQTAHTWDRLATALRDEYHVIAIDQRGHGDSDWASDGDYSWPAYYSDLTQLVAALALDRFVLVGLSLGGRNSLVYAAQHPEKVSALVVVDVGPEAARQGVEEIRNFALGPDELDTFEEFVERAHRFNPRRTKESLRVSLSHSLKQLPSGRWTWKYDPAFRDPQGRPDPGPPLDLWQELPKISCPTLVVRGGESKILTPEVAERMIHTLPSGRLVTIAGAGHTVPGDRPAEFQAAVREFIGSPRTAV